MCFLSYLAMLVYSVCSLIQMLFPFIFTMWVLGWHKNRIKRTPNQCKTSVYIGILTKCPSFLESL